MKKTLDRIVFVSALGLSIIPIGQQSRVFAQPPAQTQQSTQTISGRIISTQETYFAIGSKNKSANFSLEHVTIEDPNGNLHTFVFPGKSSYLQGQYVELTYIPMKEVSLSEWLEKFTKQEIPDLNLIIPYVQFEYVEGFVVEEKSYF